MLLKCFTALLFASVALVAGQTEEEADALFDQSLLNTTGRPRSGPSTTELSLSKSQVCTAEARRKRQADSCPCSLRQNPITTFFQPTDWIKPSGCCPKSQNYDCGASRAQVLPCFHNYVNGSLEWCCPVRPYYIYNCNCSTCVKDCGRSCFQTGTCRRRYTSQTVYAVCYNFLDGWWGWGRCRALPMSLPTSCSCSARCPLIRVIGTLTSVDQIRVAR